MFVRPGERSTVSRISSTDGQLLVPAGVALEGDRPLDHLLFALKHEGINLQVLMTIMPHIPAVDLQQALCKKNQKQRPSNDAVNRPKGGAATLGRDGEAGCAD